jgi:hypothetical protein
LGCLTTLVVRRSCGGGYARILKSRARQNDSPPPASGSGSNRELADLPARLSIFGLTRLPAARLQVLSAIAAHRDVHLHLVHSSPAPFNPPAATWRPV